MSTLERSQTALEAERVFAQALEACMRARELDARSADYVESILTVIACCQETISLDPQHGDAHVLLANAFYMLHLKIYPVTGNELPLRLAGAIIQHWSDQPIREHRSATNVEKGCRAFDVIASELSEIQPECAEREELEMRYLESELYQQALVASPREWTAA